MSIQKILNLKKKKQTGSEAAEVGTWPGRAPTRPVWVGMSTCLMLKSLSKYCSKGDENEKAMALKKAFKFLKIEKNFEFLKNPHTRLD